MIILLRAEGFQWREKLFFGSSQLLVTRLVVGVSTLDPTLQRACSASKEDSEVCRRLLT